MHNYIYNDNCSFWNDSVHPFIFTAIRIHMLCHELVLNSQNSNYCSYKCGSSFISEMVAGFQFTNIVGSQSNKLLKIYLLLAIVYGKSGNLPLSGSSPEIDWAMGTGPFWELEPYSLVPVDALEGLVMIVVGRKFSYREDLYSTLYMELSDSSFAVLGFCVFVCLFVRCVFILGRKAILDHFVHHKPMERADCYSLLYKEKTTGLISCSPSTSNQYYLMAVPLLLLLVLCLLEHVQSILHVFLSEMDLC